MTVAARFALAADEHASHSPRLRLKPKAPTTGYVDGAWWPTSRDLTAELPPILAVLAVRLGGESNGSRSTSRRGRPPDVAWRSTAATSASRASVPSTAAP
ncbi:DUF5994 family protein [Amycolatopsis sp. lyj-346]|uniref:DUF5994 family protein n=1 Tax=Amycolatopsis sp. lyj-346 TaxID=2789289 RepID=UPI00397A4051